MHEKIRSLKEIGSLVSKLQAENQTVVQCHGVFDLLHPGHVRHFQEAKGAGDVLVVSITPDRFVNKGPGRPAFTENLRLEQIASLSCVDYVVLNDAPEATSAIKTIHPDLYVKGKEYQDHAKDVTGKIREEVDAVEGVGGAVYYTDDIVFSSSNLINRFIDQDMERLAPTLEKIKAEISLDVLIANIDAMAEMDVLVVGDAILDEYQYVDQLGKSGKGQHSTAALLDRELYLGGSLIIANHISSFVKSVTLLTAVGRTCPHLEYIKSKLAPNVTPHFIYLDDASTLLKKRYVVKDGETIQKLFETYSSNKRLLSKEQSAQVCTFLQQEGNQFDLMTVADFGNGFTDPQIIEALSSAKSFLAVNTQTNSGNRGFNVITHYPRADFISLNEPEIRLAAHDRHCQLELVMQDIAQVLECPTLSVTQGTDGVMIYSKDEGLCSIPALVTQTVDRVGAGDSFLALSALCAQRGFSAQLTAFLGSIAAAIDVQIVGNKEAITKQGVLKYLTRLLK